MPNKKHNQVDLKDKNCSEGQMKKHLFTHFMCFGAWHYLGKNKRVIHKHVIHKLQGTMFHHILNHGEDSRMNRDFLTKYHCQHINN